MTEVQGGESQQSACGHPTQAGKIHVEKFWLNGSAVEPTIFVYYQRGSFSWVTNGFRCFY